MGAKRGAKRNAALSRARASRPESRALGRADIRLKWTIVAPPFPFFGLCAFAPLRLCDIATLRLCVKFHSQRANPAPYSGSHSVLTFGVGCMP